MNACTDRHIVLVGMMGAGKSSVGRMLAARLDRRLFDSDEMIEESAGRTVREIWDADGEPVFRTLETESLRAALSRRSRSEVAFSQGSGVTHSSAVP